MHDIVLQCILQYRIAQNFDRGGNFDEYWLFKCLTELFCGMVIVFQYTLVNAVSLFNNTDGFKFWWTSW